MRDAVIVSCVRTAVGKAPRGTLRSTRPDDLAAIAIKEAIARAKGPDTALEPKEVEDVILGCAMPEAEQGMNVARIAALRAGFPVETSAMTINRFCSSGLQAIAIAAERIMAGQGDVIVAGGTESMTMVPMGGNKISPNPWLMDHYPDAYLTWVSRPKTWPRNTASRASRPTNSLCEPPERRLPRSRPANSRTKSCRSK